jgi:hypothetical protein
MASLVAMVVLVVSNLSTVITVWEVVVAVERWNLELSLARV